MKKQQKQRQLRSSKPWSQVHLIEEVQELITAAGVERSAEALTEAQALFEAAIARWHNSDNPSLIVDVTAQKCIISGLQIGLIYIDELTDLTEVWEDYVYDLTLASNTQKPIIEKGIANMIIRSRFRAQAICEFANQVYDAVAALVVLCDTQIMLLNDLYRAANDIGYNGSDGEVPLPATQVLNNMRRRAEWVMLRQTYMVIVSFHQALRQANGEVNQNLDDIEDAWWGNYDDD